MKIQTIIRMQVAVVAIGAAFLLASAAHAQEIDNPSFAQPDSVPFSQPRPAPASANVNAAAQEPQTTVAYASVAGAPVATITEPVATQAGVFSHAPTVEGWSMATMAICIALFTLLLRMENRRRKAHLGRRRVSGLSSRAAIS